MLRFADDKTGVRSGLGPDLAVAGTSRDLAVFNASSEPLPLIRQKHHDRMAFLVFELDPHRVRVGPTDIRNNGGGAQGVTFRAETLNENLEHGNTGGLLALSRITGDELGLAGCRDRGCVRKELTPFVQHLPGKGKRSI